MGVHCVATWLPQPGSDCSGRSIGIVCLYRATHCSSMPSTMCHAQTAAAGPGSGLIRLAVYSPASPIGSAPAVTPWVPPQTLARRPTRSCTTWVKQCNGAPAPHVTAASGSASSPAPPFVPLGPPRGCAGRAFLHHPHSPLRSRCLPRLSPSAAFAWACRGGEGWWALASRLLCGLSAVARRVELWVSEAPSRTPHQCTSCGLLDRLTPEIRPIIHMCTAAEHPVRTSARII